MSQIIMQTFTGRYIDLANIKDDDLCIEDIAHSLSNQCRYGGHTRLFYSVAEHSVLASKLGKYFCMKYPEEMKLAFGQTRNSATGYALALLLHDASEAYLSDVITPIKNKLPDYMMIEMDIQNRIEKLLDTPETRPEDNTAIKAIDILLLCMESSVLLPSSTPILTDYLPKLPGFMREWFLTHWPQDVHWSTYPQCLTPEQAKDSFLYTFECLNGTHPQQELQYA